MFASLLSGCLDVSISVALYFRHLRESPSVPCHTDLLGRAASELALPLSSSLSAAQFSVLLHLLLFFSGVFFDWHPSRWGLTLLSPKEASTVQMLGLRWWWRAACQQPFWTMCYSCSEQYRVCTLLSEVWCSSAEMSSLLSWRG